MVLPISQDWPVCQGHIRCGLFISLFLYGYECLVLVVFNLAQEIDPCFTPPDPPSPCPYYLIRLFPDPHRRFLQSSFFLAPSFILHYRYPFLRSHRLPVIDFHSTKTISSSNGLSLTSESVELAHTSTVSLLSLCLIAKHQCCCQRTQRIPADLLLTTFQFNHPLRTRS